ncbi:hypothetical protein SynRS9902_02224 [Synechococcus sp. RS9902]|nr:hypothetical protein SynRS9902_02224 [Synechococcus sp. RS9902]
MFSATLQIQNSKSQHFRFAKDLKPRKALLGPASRGNPNDSFVQTSLNIVVFFF